MLFFFLLSLEITKLEDSKSCSWLPISSVQSLSRVQLFVIPWTAACQPSLSITNSWNLLKLMSIEWVNPTISSSVVPFSSRLQSFPALGSFPMSQFSASGGQSIGVSASASVLPMNIQDWFPLQWTGWISLWPKDFSNAIVQKHQFCTQLSFWCDHSPRARHPGMWSQVGLGKHHYRQN